MTNFKRNPATMPDGYIVLPTIPDPGVPTVAYARWGCYYNWHAMDSASGLAPDGYKVATKGDLETLREYIGNNYEPLNDNIYAGIYSSALMKDVWWGFASSFAVGTNESGFNWLPAGQLTRGGDFIQYNYRCYLWTSSTTSGGRPYGFTNSWFGGYNPGFFDGIGPNIGGESISQYKRWGFSIRCLLNTGETPPANGKAEDIDGNPYDVIQIGTQYWMVQNLRTTKFKNGNSIPQGTDASDWDTKSNNGAAFAYYNFNANYV